MNLRWMLIASPLLTTANAYALSGFPGQIRDHLGLATAPQCTLCHGSTAGGGPIVQPFGKAMVAAGLTTSGGSTLTRALDTLERSVTDSDDDGVGDIEELISGTDPNPAKQPIEYGCGGQLSPTSPGGLGASLFGVVTLALLLARRARGGSGRSSDSYAIE